MSSPTQQIIREVDLIVGTKEPDISLYKWADKESAIAWFFMFGATFSFISSYTGVARLKIDISLLNDNSLIGMAIFISLVITISERIAETYRLNYFLPDKQRKISQVLYDKNQLTNNSEQNEEEHLKNNLITSVNILKVHTISTQRRMLQVTFIVGIILGCLGFLRFFTYFIDANSIGGEWVNIIVDSADILLSAVLVSGGTKGWNDIVKSISNIITKRRS